MKRKTEKAYSELAYIYTATYSKLRSLLKVLIEVRAFRRIPGEIRTMLAHHESRVALAWAIAYREHTQLSTEQASLYFL